MTTPCPAWTSRTPLSCCTRSVPFNTTVISSNSGRWPGSSHPLGEIIRATLTRSWPELTCPANSWICFGLVPTQAMTVGFSINLGMRVSLEGVEGGLKSATAAGQRRHLLGGDPRHHPVAHRELIQRRGDDRGGRLPGLLHDPVVRGQVRVDLGGGRIIKKKTADIPPQSRR